MPAFRFRAAPALEQRRREEDAAAAAMTHAEGLFSDARARALAARQRQQDAGAALAAAARLGSDGGTLQWHRNWMTGLAATALACDRDVERHAAAVSRARQAFFLARRRRLMLERLRDRALQRHRQLERRLELKVIDEVARARYMQQAPAAEGSQE